MPGSGITIKNCSLERDTPEDARLFMSAIRKYYGMAYKKYGYESALNSSWNPDYRKEKFFLDVIGFHEPDMNDDMNTLSIAFT